MFLSRDTATAKRERYRMEVRANAMLRAEASIDLALSPLRQTDQLMVLHRRMTAALAQDQTPHPSLSFRLSR